MPVVPMGVSYAKLEFDKGKVEKSAHEVKRCFFTNANGKRVTGYYKPFASNYKRFVALCAVAAGRQMRSSIGEQSCEDRVVFDENQIEIGTISIEIPGFVPMLRRGEPLPKDELMRRRVCPTVDEMLDTDIAAPLVAGRFNYDDDQHPGNFGSAYDKERDLYFYARLDNDMAFWDIVGPVKGYRIVEGSMKELPHIGLKVRSKLLDNCPNNMGQMYSPANTPEIVLGSSVIINYKQIFHCAEEFKKLASNPRKGDICFQDQLFTQCLRDVASFDPGLSRAFQGYYLGDMLVDLKSLEPDELKTLIIVNPPLFANRQDSDLFADFIQEYISEKYNEKYRAVIFYWGCEKNNYGAEVVGFCDFLRRKPSAFRAVKAWFIGENAKMTDSYNTYIDRKEKGLCADDDPLDSYCFPPSFHYDLAKIDQVYHQIWRDAHMPMIRACLSELIDLVRGLVPTNRAPTNSRELQYEDEEFTSMGQLFEDNFEQFYQLVNQSKMSDRYSAIPSALLDFISQWVTAVKGYVNKKAEELTLADNEKFLSITLGAITTYQQQIKESLINNEGCLIFSTVIREVEELCGNFNLAEHLQSNDIPLDDCKVKIPSFILREHADPKIVKAGINALFKWADEIDLDTLKNIILYVKEKEYEPISAMKPICNRTRGEKIAYYLKNTTDKGSDILAFIFSEGGDESTSLNQLLLKKMMQLVCEKVGGLEEISLFNIKKAFEYNRFDTQKYLDEAVLIAQTSIRFRHQHSRFQLQAFNMALYRLLNFVDKAIIKKLLLEVIKQYKPSSINFLTNKGRVTEATNIANNPELSNARKIALIFIDGKLNDNSLNVLLFTQLMNTLLANSAHFPIVNSKIEQYLQTLRGYNDYLHKDYYLNSLAHYATIECKVPTAGEHERLHIALYHWFDKLNEASATGYLTKYAHGNKALSLIARANQYNSEKLALFFHHATPQIQNEMFTSLVALLKDKISCLKTIPAESFEKAEVLLNHLPENNSFYLDKLSDTAYLVLQKMKNDSIQQFYSALFSWVDNQSPRKILDILTTAVNGYERSKVSYASMFGVKSKKRGPMAREIINNQNLSAKEKILTLFSTGNTSDKSLNTLLFKGLLEQARLPYVDNEISHPVTPILTPIQFEKRLGVNYCLTRLNQDALELLAQQEIIKRASRSEIPRVTVYSGTC